MSQLTRQMYRPSSAADDEPPPAKRPKAFRACAQCVSGKTRCEDIKAKGCWLCRRKRKECSLAGTVDTEESPQPYQPARSYADDMGGMGGGPYPPPMPAYHYPRPMDMPGGDWGAGPSGEAGMLSAGDARISAAEQRIAALERELKELRVILPSAYIPQAQPNGHRGSYNPSPAAMPMDEETGSRAFKLVHMAQIAQLEDFSETIFSLSSPDAFPSVISAGIMRQEDVDLAFQSFKHKFSTILPLAPFLSISTPTPTHNFVVLACLHHVPGISSARLAELVDRSLVTAMSGNIGEDVVLAFLILSLAQAVPVSRRQGARPTPLRLISLAYQLGRDLGLDIKVQAFLGRGKDLAEPFWAGPMQLVQMWTAVVNRYNILHLMHGHGRALPTSPAPLIPRSYDPHVQRTTDHLQDENRLADLALATMRPLMAVEAGQHDFEDVKRGMQEFQAGMDALVAWKRSGGSPLLDLDQRCLEHVAVLRLCFLFQRIPSPLQPIRQTLIAGMSIFVATALRFLATLFPDNIPTSTTSLGYSPAFLRRSDSTPSETAPHAHDGAPAPSPPLLPAHVTMCATLAVLFLRGSAAHTAHRGDIPDVAAHFQLDRVARAERILRSLGGMTEAVFRQADESFGTTEEVMRGMEEAKRAKSVAAVPGSGGPTGQWQGGNPMTGLDIDFDLFSWDPSFLVPDWLPAPSATPQGWPGAGPANMGPSGGAGAGGGPSQHLTSNHQQDWVDALR